MMYIISSHSLEFYSSNLKRLPQLQYWFCWKCFPKRLSEHLPYPVLSDDPLQPLLASLQSAHRPRCPRQILHNASKVCGSRSVGLSNEDISGVFGLRELI